MSLIVCTEPYYHQSAWCGEILNAMYKEANRKKMKIILLTEISELKKISDREKGGFFSVFLVGTTFKWLTETMMQVVCYAAHPIVVSNLPPNAFQGTYSYISSDLQGATRFLIEYLKEHHRKRIALYGINTESLGDICKADVFVSCNSGLADSNEKNHIYINEGSMEQCFRSFIPFADNYDAIICANDYAAISLVQRLKRQNPGKLSSLFITSFSDTVIAKLYSPTITSLSPNFVNFGRAAITAYEYLQKHSEVSAIHLLVKWTFRAKETTQFLLSKQDEASWTSLLPELLPVKSNETFSFYQDNEVHQLLALEMIFRHCDPLDFSILSGVLQNKTYQSISELNYLSEASVKYRIKKLLEYGRFRSRKELINILQDIIGFDNIERYIKSDISYEKIDG